MVDVTLISPSAVNLGVRSVSSYLKAHGYTTRCLFLDHPEIERYPDKTLDSLVKLCSDSKIIGISTIQSVREKTVQIIQNVKSQNNFMVVGGYDATLVPHHYEKADYICIGDGELVLLDLIKRVIGNDPPEDKILPLLSVLDLNTLPEEDYDTSNHFSITNNGQIKKLERLLTYRNPRSDTTDSLFYITSRGCPYQCSYCEEPAYIKASGLQKLVRHKTPEKVVAEIISIKINYPELKQIYFVDPEFFAKSDTWIEQFSKLYKKNINLPFWIFGHPSSISEHKLSLLANAGLKELEVGIQSGSEKTRKEIYERHSTNKTIVDKMLLIRKYNITPWVDIIFDNPYENQSDILETIKLLVSFPKPFKLGSFGLDFLEGTPLAIKAEKEGKATPTNVKNLHNRKVSKSKEIYLNTLIRSMSGDCTNEMLGRIPINKISMITSPKVIDFMNQNSEFAQTLDAIIESNAELFFAPK